MGMMENVGQQSMEKMILVLKEELEGERDKRKEAEEKANRFSDQLQMEAKEKEAEMVRELEQVKTEKKILEQTVLCEIKSKKRKQRGGEFESIFEEMEDFLLKAFFIRPIQGMAPHL